MYVKTEAAGGVGVGETEIIFCRRRRHTNATRYDLYCILLYRIIPL